MITMAAERALALLESYAQARVEEKALRRQMQSLACMTPDDGRCYMVRDEIHYCPACRARSEAWKVFKSIHKANKATLRRLEDMGLGLKVPDRPDQPAEPMGLLELMHDG